MPSYRLPSHLDRPPPGRRATGLALAVGFNLLVVLALIGIGVRPPVPMKPSGVTTVELISQSPEPAAEAEKAAAPARPEQPSETAPPPPVREPPPIVLPTKPAITEPRLQMIEVSREDYAAAEIGRLPATSAAAGHPDDSEEVGRGPNGEILYAAEWAREPTAAELRGYLPANAPEGWGLIACKTVPRNRVEDCIELGQSPRGSRLASAIRQAAWQFRVRPPRRNGRPMIGEWVRIRIDYIHSASD